MRRVPLAAAAVVMGALVSVASPAHAANGPWAGVSAGVSHTCGINASKSLYCWGYNQFGQVGDGTDTDRHSQTRVGSAGVWASVSTGYTHTCAVTTGNSLYCWGRNDKGQVGDGTTTQRLLPKKIGTTGAWASVAVGARNTCAVTTAKSLYCWGDNSEGQIGDGTVEDRLSPKRIGSAGVWAGATVGDLHTCAITTGNSLYCWGFNSYGQVLGNGDNTEIQSAPRKVGPTGAWALADAGDYHTCAITTSKSLYCWGYNQFGQVGDGTDLNSRLTLTRIGTAGAWARVSAGASFDGESHTCAVTTSKSLYCWGHNTFGQVGDGTHSNHRPSPRRIGTAGVWAGTTSGGYHTCAVTTAGALYCWGANGNGQYGNGVNDSNLTPTKIP